MKLKNHRTDANCVYCFGRLGIEGLICTKCGAGCCIACSRNKTKVRCRCDLYFPRYLPTYRCFPTQPAPQESRPPRS